MAFVYRDDVPLTMQSTPRIVAVVPAAGLSRRMGAPKLALKLGSKTVLQWVVDKLVAAGVGRILVIVGPSTEFLKTPPIRADFLELPSDTPDMRTTLTAGLESLAATGWAEPDGFLLALADHPTISVDVTRRLLVAFAKEPACIHLPSHQGKRGHPAVFPFAALAKIKALPADVGVNQLLRNGEFPVQLTEMGDPCALEDMDTPEDFQAIRQREWDD